MFIPLVDVALINVALCQMTKESFSSYIVMAFNFQIPILKSRDIDQQSHF
jgi:hypothetical protein